MVDERNPLKDIPLEERSLYDQAFIQVSNFWPHSEQARELAFSKRLARIAAELMGTRGVRMWHDQALYKEPSGGFTPWHVDQQYWPMASPHSVTAWIPLQDTPIEMGPLCFGRGSHRKHIGRDLEISAESEQQIREAVRKEKIDRSAGAVRAGRRELPPRLDAAPRGPQHDEPARAACSRLSTWTPTCGLANPKNKNQQLDWEIWTPSTQIGEVMDDPLNPVLYES